MAEKANRPAAFAEKLRLHPAKGKGLLLLVISIVFTLVGVSMIGEGQWKGWPATVFFGLASVFFTINLFWPSASYLDLSPDGFVVCALFRPSPLIRWDSVSEFRVVRIPPKRTKMVGFDVNASLHPSLSATVRRVVGASGTLPDTYGRKPDELVDLMNQWRRKALVDK